MLIIVFMELTRNLWHILSLAHISILLLHAITLFFSRIAELILENELLIEIFFFSPVICILKCNEQILL